MATDHKRLIAEARMFAEARGERRNTAIVSRLADALEAATARTDREPQPGDGPDYHAEHASWLNRNRAVVEAQALEQAADIAMDYEAEAAARRNDSDYPESHIGQWYGGVARGAEDVALRLRARAVEIREGRQ